MAKSETIKLKMNICGAVAVTGATAITPDSPGIFLSFEFRTSPPDSVTPLKVSLGMTLEEARAFAETIAAKVADGERRIAAKPKKRTK